MVEKTIVGILRNPKASHPRRCETCTHFDPPQGMSDQGSCTHELPNAVMVPTGPGQLANITYFPQMKPEQRCAKWEPDDEDHPVPY